MKKVLTALGNNVLNEELRKYSKYEVLCEDIFYQEGVLEFLEKEEADTIIISALLQGQMNFIEFASEVKKLNYKARVILIVDEISEEEKNILISKGIFDILRDSDIEIQDVFDVIDREEPIDIKAQLEREAKLISESMKNTNIQAQDSNNSSHNIRRDNVISLLETKTINHIHRQEIVSFFGTPGSGKSSICANLAKYFSNCTDSKILVIDLDTLNGNLDDLVGVQSKVPENVELLIDEDKRCGINYAADLYSKNRLTSNVFEEIVIKSKGFDLLTGNTSIHYCQNVLNEKIYKKILECAKEKYDFIFIDLSSNIFLDATKWALKESTKVLFVTENSNICVKKSMQLMHVIINNWNVYKDKISLIINKFNSNEIDADTIASILEIKLAGIIKNDFSHCDESYEKILSELSYVPKRSLIKKFLVTINRECAKC